VIGGGVEPLGRSIEIVLGVLAVMVHPRRTGSLALSVHVFDEMRNLDEERSVEWNPRMIYKVNRTQCGEWRTN